MSDDRNDNDELGVSIPAFVYYQRTYATSLENNDQKALGVFKQYEADEKVRSLQTDLMRIKDGMIKENTLDSSVGKKRKGKYGTYERWASLMLLWLSQAKD